MFRFAQPIFLFLLLLIPILIGIFAFLQIQRKRNLRKLGDMALLEQFMPNISFRRPWAKMILLSLTIFFIVIALARPQFGTRKITDKRHGIEVMIALDVSNSMLAQDVQPNRLEKSKQIIAQLVDKMTDDRVGLVVFAGDAYVQLPITADYVSAKMFLSGISPNLVPRQGTAIGSALDLCIRSFGENKSKIGRTIVLITDGENHEDDAVEAAKLAANSGIQVNVIGMGTPEGQPIPIQGTMSFKKDRAGNVVVSKLNEEMCKQIALEGDGIYVRADNTNNAQRVLAKQIDTLAEGDFESESVADYSEQFQSFALIALLLLIVDSVMFSRKNKILSKIRIFDLKQKITK
jgi:Ca-activated chloride channel family protein